MKIYVVQQGDNVDDIAASQGISAEKLIYDNQIGYPYRLAVGQALLIDDGIFPEDRPPLYVFGYAYPVINPDNLDNTLPYLTDIYMFSYGFTETGELLPPMSEDDWLVERASAAGVGSVLVLTPLGADGRFNNHLISAVVQNEEAQQRLIWNVGRKMQEKGYMGLDIDFEYVPSGDKEAFAVFLARITDIMNSFGYQVSVDLVPKTSSEQRGELYEGMDYGLLGEAANRVLLMTYEWGYTYGEPMAVAPINQVRRVVDYAVSQIPREKISLGIPQYGYDWPLPYERGVTKARTINSLEAIRLAIEHGAEIHFDQTAMTPYFRYWQYGVQHEVWFEDLRSYRAKLQLIKEFGLTGVGYWQLMQFFRPNWLLLQNMFEIRKNGRE